MFVASLIIIIVLLILVFVVDDLVVRKYYKRVKLYRELHSFDVLWLSNTIAGKRMKEFFVANGYKQVGIIGHNDYTHLIYEELSSEGIQVLFCVDNRFCDGMSPVPGLDMISPEDAQLRDHVIDVYIINSINSNDSLHYYSIYEELLRHSNVRVVSLYELCCYTSELLS